MEKKIVLDDKLKLYALSGAILIVTLFLSHKIVAANISKVRQASSKIKEKKKAVELIKEIDRLGGIIRKYRKSLDKKTDFLVLRRTLSEIAETLNIEVLSLEPRPTEKFGKYVKIACRLDLRCTYDQLGAFLAEIERLPGVTVVDELAAQMSANYKMLGKEEGSIPEAGMMAKVSLKVSQYSLK